MLPFACFRKKTLLWEKRREHLIYFCGVDAFQKAFFFPGVCLKWQMVCYETSICVSKVVKNGFVQPNRSKVTQETRQNVFETPLFWAFSGVLKQGGRFWAMPACSWLAEHLFGFELKWDFHYKEILSYASAREHLHLISEVYLYPEREQFTAKLSEVSPLPLTFHRKRNTGSALFYFHAEYEAGLSMHRWLFRFVPTQVLNQH